jgi:NADH:flavin oxidoreductase / NADH oxidase family
LVEHGLFGKPAATFPDHARRGNDRDRHRALSPSVLAASHPQYHAAESGVFAPVCPTWVRNPHEGIFTEQAVAYYEERAKTGLGMIILGGHLINKDTIYTPLGFPGLWNDAQLEGLANVARAVKRHGCALSVQLLHLGLRSPTPFLKTDLARDPDEYNPYMLAPSQVPAGEIPGGRHLKSSKSTRSNTFCSATRMPPGARYPPA